MATNVAHEKPESEDQPTVKKLRIDEDAASVESASTTEDRAESVDASAEDSGEEKDLESAANGSSATVSTPKAAPSSSGFGGFSGFSGFSSYSGGGGFSGFAKPAESTTSTVPSSTSSGFGAFAKTAESSSSSGFSGFAMSAESSSGFGAFAKADDASEGFGEAATADFDPNAEENTAEFTPVVTLTEAERTVNGEEGERLIVEKRAKLFKLIGTDYAEVGVGPFRVLQPKDAREIEQVRASARIVMRRESYPRGPGTKLILNARLTACVSCVKKSEKSLMVVVVEAPSSEGKDQEATASTDQDNKIKPVTYLLRFASQEDLLLVQDRVVDLLPARAATS